MVVPRAVVILFAFVTLANAAAVTAIATRRITTRTVWAEVTVDDATALDCRAKGKDNGDTDIAAVNGGTCSSTSDTSKYNCFKAADKKCLVEFAGLVPNKAYDLSCKVAGGTDKTVTATTLLLDIVVYPYSSVQEQGGASYSDRVTVKVWLQSNSPKLGGTRTVVCAFANTAPADYDAIDTISGADKLSCDVAANQGQFTSEQIVFNCEKGGVGSDSATDTSVKTVYCALKDVAGGNTAKSAVRSVTIQNKAKVPDPPATVYQDSEVDTITWSDSDVYADAMTFTVKWKAIDSGKVVRDNTKATCKVYESGVTDPIAGGTFTNEFLFATPPATSTAKAVTVLKPAKAYTVKCKRTSPSDGTEVTSAAKTTPEVTISLPNANILAWNTAFEVTPVENVLAAADVKCRALTTQPQTATTNDEWKNAAQRVDGPTAVWSGLTYSQTAADNKRFFQCGIVVTIGGTEYVKLSSGTAVESGTLREPPAISELKIVTPIYSDQYTVQVTVLRPGYTGNDATKLYFGKTEFYATNAAGPADQAADGAASATCGHKNEGAVAASCTYTKTYNEFEVANDDRKIKVVVVAGTATGTVTFASATAGKNFVEVTVPQVAWTSELTSAVESTIGYDKMYSTKVRVLGDLNTATGRGKVVCKEGGTSPVAGDTSVNCNVGQKTCIYDKNEIAISTTPAAVTIKCAIKIVDTVIAAKEKTASPTPAAKAMLSDAVTITGTSKYTATVSATNSVTYGKMTCEIAGGNTKVIQDAACTAGTCTSSLDYRNEVGYDVQDACTGFIRCYATDKESKPANPADADKKPPASGATVDGAAGMFLAAVNWATNGEPAAAPTDTKVVISAKANRAKVTLYCVMAKPNIGYADGVAQTAQCGDDGTCTATWDNLTPLTDYNVWCVISEKEESGRDVTATNPQKLSMPVPAKVVATKTLAGAQFSDGPSSSEVTYSSAKITVKINTADKKFECYPVKGAGSAEPSNWEQKRTITIGTVSKEIPIKVKSEGCGAKDASCSLYLSYLEPGSSYTVWCRPEGVVDSKKKVEFGTNAALEAGSDKLTYTITLTEQVALDATTFKDDAHKSLRDTIIAILKIILKLPATATIELVPNTAAHSKYTLQVSTLKIDIIISNLKKDSHAAIYTALVSSIRNGGLTESFNQAGLTASVDKGSDVVNRQGSSTTTSSGSDDSEDDGAASMFLSLAAAFFALLSVAAWL